MSAAPPQMWRALQCLGGGELFGLDGSGLWTDVAGPIHEFMARKCEDYEESLRRMGVPEHGV